MFTTGNVMGRPRKNHLRDWQPSGHIPNTYFAIVGRHSVLIPLTGKLKNWKRDTAAHTHKLTAMWRARLSLLDDHYLEQFLYCRASTKKRDAEYHLPPERRERKRFWSMMNCRPQFFVPAEQGFTCGIPTLCPHCWARNVGETWKKVDSLLFPGIQPWEPKAVMVAPGMAQQQTVQCRGIETDDEEDGPRAPRLYGTSAVVLNIPVKLCRGPRRDLGTELDALTEFIQRRTSLRAFRMPRPDLVRGRFADQRDLLEVGCAGGLETLSVTTFVPGSDPGDYAWRVGIRQLLFVPNHLVKKVLREAARMLPSFISPEMTSKVHEDPSRKKLVYLVARVMQYDKLLMTGEPERALLALRARGGHRLTTTFGSLYRRSS
jgi:hypothetical protein